MKRTRLRETVPNLLVQSENMDRAITVPNRSHRNIDATALHR